MSTLLYAMAVLGKDEISSDNFKYRSNRRASRRTNAKIGTVGIAILCRDLGVGLSVVPWVLYAIFATPMIVMLSHREVVGAPLLTRGILYAMIAVPAIYLLSRQTGLGG